MIFYVGIREVHVRTIEFEADSWEDALAMSKTDIGRDVSFEWSHNLDSSHYSVTDENGITLY